MCDADATDLGPALEPATLPAPDLTDFTLSGKSICEPCLLLERQIDAFYFSRAFTATSLKAAAASAPSFCVLECTEYLERIEDLTD